MLKLLISIISFSIIYSIKIKGDHESLLDGRRISNKYGDYEPFNLSLYNARNAGSNFSNDDVKERSKKLEIAAKEARKIRRVASQNSYPNRGPSYSEYLASLNNF